MYVGHDNSYLTHGGIYEVSNFVIKTTNSSPTVILDMGSRHGEGYDRLGVNFPDATYIFVEPMPDCLTHITKKCTQYPDRKLKLIDGILSENEGAVILKTFAGDDHQSSNLYTDRGAAYGQPIPVEVKLIPYTVLDEHENIDFAKINIEGGEYELVQSKFFDKIEHFVIELHNFIPGKSYNDVITLLQDHYDLTTYGNLSYKYCYVVGHRICNT